MTRLETAAPAGSDLPESVSAKVWREIELAGHGLAGIADAAVEAVSERPAETAAKLTLSAGIGLGLSYLSRGAALSRLAVASVGAGMGLSFLSDLGKNAGIIGRAFADSWQSDDNWQGNVKAVNQSLGRFVFETTLMSAGAFAGAAVGNRVLGRAFRLGESAPERFTFEHLQHELKISGLTESHLAAVVKRENFLGAGSNASVYRLPGAESYALRVPNGSRLAPSTSLEKVADILPGTNVGQPVARLGDWTILKKQDGLPAGGPLGRFRREMGDEAANAIYSERVRMAAGMPQAAFDDFARTLVALERQGLQFDPSKAGNVLIDTAGQRFNLVDVSPTSAARPYRHSASDMIITLMDNGSAWKVTDRASLVQAYRHIIAKSLLAGQRTGLRAPSLADSSFDYSLTLARLKGDI